MQVNGIAVSWMPTFSNLDDVSIGLKILKKILKIKKKVSKVNLTLLLYSFLQRNR
ncbi:hypothetical protein ES703_107910 [subsurface metagenome]